MVVATISSPSLAVAALPPLATSSSSARIPAATAVGVPHMESLKSLGFFRAGIGRVRRSTRRRAGLTEIEPNLEEDPHDKWRTNGVSAVSNFLLVLGLRFLSSHRSTFIAYKKEPNSAICRRISNTGSTMDITRILKAKWKKEVSGRLWWPSMKLQSHLVAFKITSSKFWTFQSLAGLISWLFLPAVVAGLAYKVPDDYLYIGAAVFVVVFCVIEMNKPDKPHNFEPQIYNMDREARDKLIEEYNSMDIWDFNEKYGELWDFTVKPRDDIVKR
ncbi:hypothetical protein ZIOFF_027284 [Zingiber officinale]|uniref:Photosynthetic NDH subunit of subcomplex B 5, chloroplastic n=1 Tax=Zingiber officinale TaxID=94328 RepID=A0A8J5HG37_ZINOF|nr:hypothetical protein ZIOFF_027284 [Zingiber officinale]